MSVGGEKLTYIATQNPFSDTLEDFWTMIWMHNVSIITMVTELEERGTTKCPRYWPQADGIQKAIAIKDVSCWVSQPQTNLPYSKKICYTQSFT